MVRELIIKENELKLTDKQVEVLLERTVTPFGTSAKADVPRKHIGKRVYVVVMK